ncbi:MAG: mandelate racemase/muconate lactonizing enzyme family protein [Chloroflexota bacterium]|nr:mandelate racemase/muconate lactonizing enzyme family protein [Chloroflexota bacterium]
MTANPIVRSVEAIPVAVPLNVPTRIATREVRAREFVLVEVRTEDGQAGVGYTYTGTSGARLLAGLIDEYFAPRMVGQPALAPERVWAQLFQELLLIGRRGFLLRALSAVDIALWDLAGQVANLPLYRLLGGYRDSVPAYASGGYYRPGDPLAEIEREMGRYKDLGFSDFKMKVGGAPLDVDVQRVRVARETIGPVARLGLDANNAWRTPSEALKFARAVERYEPWWLEEPLLPDDVEGHAQIAAALEWPVATGEIHSTRWDFRQLIERRAADILQPDAGVLGGVGEWMRVAHAAATFDLPVAPHWHADVHAQLVAAVPNGLTVEYFLLEEDIYNFERLLAERLRPKDGVIPLPDRPGVGLVLDRDAVGRFRIG